ncbi:hypothetical protein [Streptomyces sanglieri]|uniref:hypothetical protein n=1 Tax=Streptomyces sanglieri TaxID=193460 RepID=UPI003525BC8A
MADEDQEADEAVDNEPTARPLPRLGWHTQSILFVLLEDPSREVWPFWTDQRTKPRSDSAPILKRLAQAGWLTTRRETDKPNARVLYRLTPTGEVLAREAVKRPVEWPSNVAHHRPSTEPQPSGGRSGGQPGGAAPCTGGGSESDGDERAGPLL